MAIGPQLLFVRPTLTSESKHLQPIYNGAIASARRCSWGQCDRAQGLSFGAGTTPSGRWPEPADRLDNLQIDANAREPLQTRSNHCESAHTHDGRSSTV